MLWHDEYELLSNVAIVALSSKEMPNATCCNNPEIHIHAHSIGFWKQRGRGSAWIWCSNCGAYAHLDGVPIDKSWRNNSSVDFEQVTAVPKYLETVKGSVDKHLIEFLES